MSDSPDGPAHAAPAAGEAAPERPLGLSLLIWLFWFWTGAIVLVFLGFAIGDGPIMLSGRAVPRPDALAAVLPILLPMGLATVGAALALGLDRHWARPAVLLPFALAAVSPAFTGAGYDPVDLVLSVVVLLAIVAALVWYLYFSPGVRAHFARLRHADAPDGGATGPQRGM